MKNCFRVYVYRFVCCAALLAAVSPGVSAGTKVIPPAVGVYQGAFPFFGPLEDRVSTGTLSHFNVLARKPIAWAYFSNNWFHGINFPAAAIRAIYRTGSVPFVRLMPRTGFNLPDTLYSLQQIIDGRFDVDLTRWALAAKHLIIPLMIEFAGEPNGDWFPWSGVYNGGGRTDGYGDPTAPDGPERYRDAYRHIVDLFRSLGVDNVTWVYHVNSGSAPDQPWNRMASYYPGDDYIDWIGESAYGAQVPGDQWELLTDVLDSSYPELSHISDSKPLALLEYGVISDGIRGHKAAWIKEGLDSIRSGRYPRIKGISYWHSKFRNSNRSYSNMRIDSSPDVLQTYRSEMADAYFVSRVQFSGIVPQLAGLNDRGPTAFSLDQNYPNPFNPATAIEYALPVDAMVSLTVYNVLGQIVATLVDAEHQGEGYQQAIFDGAALPSGTYFYRLEAIAETDPGVSFARVKKMVLIK